MKISECDVVIFAGGQGTRIRHLLPDGQPKCLADINGRPFLEIYMEHLIDKGFETFAFCLGYGADEIKKFLYQNYRDRCEWVVEPEPLGTGGALRFAMREMSFYERFFVLNADTYFGELDFQDMLDLHNRGNGQFITSCKYNHKFVGAFVADLRMREVLEWEHREKFAMGDLPLHAHSLVLEVDTPFIDIGTPEGLAEARARFPGPPEAA